MTYAALEELSQQIEQIERILRVAVELPPELGTTELISEDRNTAWTLPDRF
jgi:hypothetical protein